MESRDPSCWKFLAGGNYSIGGISSSISTILTFPIYKTVFRQQLHTLTIRSAVQQLRTEGLVHLYRGLKPPLIAKTVQGTLLFGTQPTILSFLSEEAKPKTKYRFLSGLISGGLEAVVFAPFERLQNILQDGRNNSRFPSVSSIMHDFHSYDTRNKLFCGFYRGFTPILARNALGSALYFSCKEPVRDVLSLHGMPAWVSSFVSGTVNGALISLALYPLSVLVSNMQAQAGKGLPSAVKMMGSVWMQCGGKVSQLYRGASLIALRSCITWGVTTAIHDTLRNKMSS
ncbi:solute carrier family 25 member 53 [Bombina bombina]|uniref:solute carrier family 25 member 53 n=1 Tax=Bombina bombina TaxID=8345 RepID=UPI00235A6C71|nr:solute carrier family 25 member 53 [Bombina bombina]